MQKIRAVQQKYAITTKKEGKKTNYLTNELKKATPQMRNRLVSIRSLMSDGSNLHNVG